jgi:hypothetical protein
MHSKPTHFDDSPFPTSRAATDFGAFRVNSIDYDKTEIGPIESDLS